MKNIETQTPELNFEKYTDGLMPAIVQDTKTGEIMMQGFVNQEALDKTRETGLATFYSRSQKKLWTKGMTSGDTLSIKRIFTDCDNDSIIYEVEVDGEGACCQPGWDSCFQREIDLNTGKIESLLGPKTEWENLFANNPPIPDINAKKEKGKIFIGIPSGSLNKQVIRLCIKAGFLECDPGRNYEITCSNSDIVFRILDRKEMAMEVADGVVDAGITGKDYIFETGYQNQVEEIADYIFSKKSNKPSRVVLVSSPDLIQEIEQTKGQRIATELPNLTRAMMAEKFGFSKKDLRYITRSEGKTEQKLQTGRAKAITDITETGDTIKANGFLELGTIFTSNPQLIGNKESIKDLGI